MKGARQSAEWRRKYIKSYIDKRKIGLGLLFLNALSCSLLQGSAFKEHINDYPSLCTHRWGERYMSSFRFRVELKLD